MAKPLSELKAGEVVEYLNLDGDPKKGIITENRAGFNYRILTFNGRDIPVDAERIQRVLAQNIGEYVKKVKLHSGKWSKDS